MKNILNALHRGNFTDGDWFDLGQQLITNAALNTIEADHGGKKHLMIDMVSLWLKSDLNASWETLAEAVKSLEKYGEKAARIVRENAGIGKITTLISS